MPRFRILHSSHPSFFELVLVLIAWGYQTGISQHLMELMRFQVGRVEPIPERGVESEYLLELSLGLLEVELLDCVSFIRDHILTAIFDYLAATHSAILI